MSFQVDKQRVVKAVYFNWKEADYPEYGEPGQTCSYLSDHLTFACPGCGRFGSIRATHPKDVGGQSWDITAGSLADITALTLSPSIHCIGCCDWHGWYISGVYQMNP